MAVFRFTSHVHGCPHQGVILEEAASEYCCFLNIGYQLSNIQHLITGYIGSIALHTQAFALQEEGISILRIKEVTGVSVAIIYCIKKKSSLREVTTLS